MNIKTILRSVSNNSPLILTVLGTAGFVTTIVLTIDGTIKAYPIVEAEKKFRATMDYEITNRKDFKPEDLEPFGKLTPKDIFLLVWRPYLPALIMGGVSIACLLGANAQNQKRAAALAGMYSLAESSLREYKEKVVEEIGQAKNDKIEARVAEERIKNNPPSAAVLNGKGDVLCYETLSGRYFRSDLEALRKLQNDLNSRLISDMFLSLNELYVELGLEPIKIGSEIGWNVDAGMIEFSFTTTLSEDGRPCLVLDLPVTPKQGYSSFY